MRAIYQGAARARRWLRGQVGDADRQDTLILLVGAMAVGGVGAIAYLWGLPA